MKFFAWLRALFSGPASKPLELPAATGSRDVDQYLIHPGETVRAAIERHTSAAPPKGEIADIPLTYWTSWSLPKAQGAIASFMQGTFADSSLLVESMIGDDRVQAALNGRLKGVTKCDISVKPVEGYDAEAEAVKEAWPKIFTEEILEALLMWTVFMGFCLCEMVWEADPQTDTWIPRLKLWHPYFVYYRIDLRRYMVMTMEGLIEVNPDDPKWFLYTPYGSYRGWIRGAVRSVWQPWMVRQLALQWWCSANEIFGIPVRKLKVPSQFSETDKARVIQQVAQMGSKSVISLPAQGGPDGVDFDLDVLETDPTSWKTFPGLLAQTEQSITLCIRGTNLTTQVDGGSYAAAETHRDEDSDYAVSDRKKLAQATKRVMELWCLYNFGNSEVCPDLSLVSPEVNKLDETDVLKGVADAVTGLKAAGFNVDLGALAERFGVPILPVSSSLESPDPKPKSSLEPVRKPQERSNVLES